MKRNQRRYLIVLIVICMGAILIGGVHYIGSLRANLSNQAVQNVLAVTGQQRQAFDTFISGDRERLHSFAEFFSSSDDHSTPEKVQRELTLFNEIDATYVVVCLDEGWFCSNTSAKIRTLTEKQIAEYEELRGSGVRESFTGIVSGNPRFGFYESFTFANGHRGLIQKSYDRTKVSETFSLSFYGDQGFSYVVNQEGDILLRPIGMIGDRIHENIADIVVEVYGEQADTDKLMNALQNRETGSMVFKGDRGAYVYTYVPVESMEGWYLVSVVREEAIAEEAEQILLDSQMTLGFFALVLVIFAVFALLIWSTHREIQSKEQEIKYQEQLFDIFSTYLARNTNDVYMLLDLASDRVEYASPNVERVLGISVQELMRGVGVLESAYASGDWIDLKAMRTLKPGDNAGTSDIEWSNPLTGEHRWFQQSVYCTQIQGMDKLVIYISDRTQDRRAQKSLAEALQMAQAANNAKSAFLSSVSHDIRTPMNAIIGFLALMRDEADNPGMVLEYTQRIDAASQHLLGLINDVLDMNKIESGSATLNLTEMSLADVIDEIGTMIRPQTRAKDQTFEILVSPLAHEHLIGDKLRINQILINLLSNAVKYTPRGGKIEMRVEELPRVLNDYSRIRFTVKDNGMGMSEEYQRVIFDPFTREETEVTHQIQGTGLGMAITKSLVDLMGGTIQVVSRLGEGSTFTVELELYIQEREDDPQFWADHSVSRMIVADDDEEICRNIVKAMAKTEVAVDYSADGENAVRMMREAREEGRPYDLILLDWKMPNLNGLETARLIRKNYPEKIPILLFTAYDWGEIEQEAAEIGINHFMPKPFFMSTFKDAIRRVMGDLRKAEEQENASVIEGKHVLVVDDIEVNRIILVKILTTLGACCDVAGNGQEALDAFAQSRPGEYDLILMDVQMPVMDGYAATRAIRSSGHPSAADIPIIAMTANAFVDDVRDAIESGMDAHIAKPIQLDNLKRTIQTVFDGRRRQDTAAEQERGLKT